MIDGEPEDELILDEEQIIEPPAEDDPPPEDNPDVNDEADEPVIMFGDEPAPEEIPESAPDWAKKLRKDYRALQQENAALKKGTAPVRIEVGPMPTIEDPDIDYDNEKLSNAMAKWIEKRDAAKAQEAEAEQAQRTAAQAWQSELAAYGQKKAELAIPGKDEAEEEATSQLTQVQQAIIVKGADNPALVVVALGKNPAKLAAISDIEDPVKFAFAIAKLEKELKVTTRKPPEVEGTVKGSAPLAQSTRAKRLAELEKKATQGGDVSNILAEMRKLRAAN